MMRLNLKHRWRLHRYRRHGIMIERVVPMESHGSGIGAWVLSPVGLSADSVVYSFGIGRDISFDLSMVHRFGCPVECFDPTPVSLEWVRRQALPAQIHVHPYGLSDHDGVMSFYPPRKARSAHFTPVPRYRTKDTTHVEASVKRLATIAGSLGHTRIDVLKVDIEGGEYAALPDMLACGIPVGQILIEFHHCYDTIPLQRTVHAVALLRRHGFQLIHISPRTYELSFLNTSVHGGSHRQNAPSC